MSKSPCMQILSFVGARSVDLWPFYTCFEDRQKCKTTFLLKNTFKTYQVKLWWSYSTWCWVKIKNWPNMMCQTTIQACSKYSKSNASCRPPKLGSCAYSMKSKFCKQKKKNRNVKQIRNMSKDQHVWCTSVTLSKKCKNETQISKM